MKPPRAQLPSWREGPTKDVITAFLDDARGVPVGQRTAVLDHDGTLRCERPTFLLFDFLVHEVRTAVTTRPGAADRADFQLLLRGDPNEIAAFGMRRCLMAAYELSVGMTPQEFTAHVREFACRGAGGQGRPDYRQLVYQPMLELIDALRTAEFTVFINARYSVEVVRAISYEYYGVPPHCVVGALIDYELKERDGNPVLVRGPTIISEISRGATNVVNIQAQTGMRPILAAGNAIGDREMLEYTACCAEPSLALLISHDDAGREYAYQQHVESLSASEPYVDLAKREGWTVVSMRDDWSTIYPPHQDARGKRL